MANIFNRVKIRQLFRLSGQLDLFLSMINRVLTRFWCFDPFLFCINRECKHLRLSFRGGKRRKALVVAAFQGKFP